MERDDLRREVYRTQGKLTSCFGYDACGRKTWQFASTLPAEKLSIIHNPHIQPDQLVQHAYNPIHRRYDYDPAGELSRTLDKLRGETRYEYEANGQLHSRLITEIDPLGHKTEYLNSEDGLPHTIIDATYKSKYLWWNAYAQVERFQDCSGKSTHYRYDDRQHLVAVTNALNQTTSLERKPDGEVLRIQHPDGTSETFTYYIRGKLESVGEYRYDSLGRRIAKQLQINGTTEQKRFLWQGLRMLREETPGQSILYVYEPGSYAPLARVDQAEGEGQKLYYFHTDQIGTP